MQRALAAVLAAAVMISISACGGEDPEAGSGKAAPAKATGGQVPEGVSEQYATLEKEIAGEGGETSTGPWRIAYIVEPAEGWFERRSGALRWRPPASGQTHHIEILPIEAQTGRLVPDVPVTLEVIDAGGERIARKRLRTYYAEFFHYAENFAVPEAGEYTLRARIEPPPFRRHGEEQERPALAEGAEVAFQNVRLEPEEG